MRGPSEQQLIDAIMAELQTSTDAILHSMLPNLDVKRSPAEIAGEYQYLKGCLDGLRTATSCVRRIADRP